MACSKFEYVKQFEKNDACLLNTWMVVRIDGHSFHRFTHEHNFAKPNDDRGLSLLNHCAQQVMENFKDIVVAYGQSDEYSFVFRRSCTVYERRESKLVSNVVSLFTSCYVMYWSLYFKDTPLKYPPSFDGRMVLYPSIENIRDYMSWRQADCHINNLYNTVFWALVLNESDPKTEKQAENILKDTDSAIKNEMLFTKFNINYNSLPQMYRKGSVLYRKKEACNEVSKRDGQSVVRMRTKLVVEHVDIVRDKFWNENIHLLSD